VTVSVRLSYDRSTDSLYIELRPLPAKRTREIEEDVMLDLGEDGEPVGYDLQHASTKRDLIMSTILGEMPRVAAE
jgi:uncharacterized protein YuzE